MSDRARRALKKAKQKAGGQGALARGLNISTQALGQWDITPPTRVIQVEALSGVRREELRPDLYPPVKQQAGA